MSPVSPLLSACPPFTLFSSLSTLSFLLYLFLNLLFSSLLSPHISSCFLPLFFFLVSSSHPLLLFISSSLLSFPPSSFFSLLLPLPFYLSLFLFLFLSFLLSYFFLLPHLRHLFSVPPPPDHDTYKHCKMDRNRRR